MVKAGDNVKVDGVVTKVTGTWGAGKHRNYQLEDGRVAADLTDECLVANEPGHGTFKRETKFMRKDVDSQLGNNDGDEEDKADSNS